MLKKIAFILLGLILILVIVIAIQPKDFSVTRSAIISAPVERVFENINNLRKWDAWSPWAKLDPQARQTFAGPDAGVGASMSWAGNMDVGEGTMTIVESKPNELVRFRLEFQKPFEGVSTSNFTLQPNADQTRLTWTMNGEKNFITKAVGLVMDCDKMVGEQFEQGLRQLDAVVSGKSAPAPSS